MMTDDIDRQSVIDRLRSERCSCVIANGGGVTVCRERGVRDLLRMLTEEPRVLEGAFIADKVVGKGAAALMVLGGVAAVYAEVVSRPALALLTASRVEVSYGVLAENIINRAGTGVCPVETLCAGAATAEECLPLIRRFVERMDDVKKTTDVSNI